MTFRITIVGRPNVGKSTLFNKIVKKRIAITDDKPGVTRDILEVDDSSDNYSYTLVDTAGLEIASHNSLQDRMTKLSLSEIKSSDMCLFVVDARAGLTVLDQKYAKTIRKLAKKVILVVNKIESLKLSEVTPEFYQLGLGEPFPISAEHSIGIEDLKRMILNNISEYGISSSSLPDNEVVFKQSNNFGNDKPFVNTDSEKSNKKLRISIIGRPNSGKSTLINMVLGFDRLLTGPEAGITRDAVSILTNWDGDIFHIFDTAGMRKKAKIQSRLEKLSITETLKAIRFSEVVVLLLDANNAFESQDLKIADLVEREGRCIILAVNKWDLVSNKKEKLKHLKINAENLLPQLRGISVVTVSALLGEGLVNLKSEILKSHEIWNRRINTAKLNLWLKDRILSHPPPKNKANRIKLRYIAQINHRPPTFALFGSFSRSIPASYKRYLVNGLREDFGLIGTPIRLLIRQSKNPYVEK